MSRGEVALNFLHPGYKRGKENSEGDSDIMKKEGQGMEPTHPRWF